LAALALRLNAVINQPKLWWWAGGVLPVLLVTVFGGILLMLPIDQGANNEIVNRLNIEMESRLAAIPGATTIRARRSHRELNNALLAHVDAQCHMMTRVLPQKKPTGPYLSGKVGEDACREDKLTFWSKSMLSMLDAGNAAAAASPAPAAGASGRVAVTTVMDCVSHWMPKATHIEVAGDPFVIWARSYGAFRDAVCAWQAALVGPASVATFQQACRQRRDAMMTEELAGLVERFTVPGTDPIMFGHLEMALP
jgi:hypothetical protein